MRHGLELGYRHIDTARAYGNETAVGRCRRPVYGKLMVCWDPDADAAGRTASGWWPVGGVGTAGADLRLPADFASVTANRLGFRRCPGSLTTSCSEPSSAPPPDGGA